VRDAATLRPGPALGVYPEQEEPGLGWLDRAGSRLAGAAQRVTRARAGRFRGVVARVDAEARRWLPDGGRLEGAALASALASLRGALARDGVTPALSARAFAIVRETAHRVLGMRHFDVQLMGGQVLLDGMLAEMDTGEGKTLTATLAACTAAFAGIPVHVITVNDYLVTRDVELLRPLYEALGLSVGAVVDGMDADARRAAYRADVTYVTNKQVAFDYLRDRMVLGDARGGLRLGLERLYEESARVDRLILRGLCYAIVDEADGVLVDEARTPLIISRPGDSDGQERVYLQALSLAARLEQDADYVVDLRERDVRLTDAGGARLDALTHPLGGVWSGRRRREELVRQALQARCLFQPDQHYLVRDGEVQIIDEYTGRVMPDRSWERGLHQMIEAKEGCEITGQRETLARISYQRFFRRYLRLAGMSGTAREVAGELWSVYRLGVVTIPANRPVRRTGCGERVYARADARWDAVVARIAELHAAGRPVLVGTRSVSASERLSAALEREGLEHSVLNARQDAEEAEIVARAGAAGRITVATNMAGRGTDIRLGPGVAERGGLHVIATERHEARRIDRQLFGRCGRQGDPGSFEAIVSLEDDLVANFARPWLPVVGAARGGLAARLRVRRAQRSAERRHARVRRELLKLDEQLGRVLAFSGRPE